MRMPRYAPTSTSLRSLLIYVELCSSQVLIPDFPAICGAAQVSDILSLHVQMIAKAIKEEIFALTEASSPHRRFVSIFTDDDEEEPQQQPGGASPMAIDVRGLDEGHLVAAAAEVLAEQPAQGPAKSSLTQQNASAFRNGRDYESSAQYPGPLSDGLLSEDGGHAAHLNGGMPATAAKAGSDMSMLSRSNSQGSHDADDEDAGSLIGRKRSSSKLNPPKEEDRTLPLKKLFENLTGVSEANQVLFLLSSVSFMPSIHQAGAGLGVETCLTSCQHKCEILCNSSVMWRPVVLMSAAAAGGGWPSKQWLRQQRLCGISRTQGSLYCRGPAAPGFAHHHVQRVGGSLHTAPRSPGAQIPVQSAFCVPGHRWHGLAQAQQWQLITERCACFPPRTLIRFPRNSHHIRIQQKASENRCLITSENGA